MIAKQKRVQVKIRDFYFLSILFFLLLPVGVSQAGEETKIRASILEVIQARHPTDGASFWKSLGPEAPEVIRTMLEENRTIYERIRLLEALAYFPEKQYIDYLKERAEKEKNIVAREAAVHAVALSSGTKEAGFLLEQTEKGTPGLRVRVATTLDRQKVSSDDSNNLVKRILAVEKEDSWVRTRFQKNHDEFFEKESDTQSEEN